jgi:hypothetical protein
MLGGGEEIVVCYQLICLPQQIVDDLRLKVLTEEIHVESRKKMLVIPQT